MLEVAASVVINIVLLVFWSSLFYLLSKQKKAIVWGLVLGIWGVFIVAGMAYAFLDVIGIKLTEEHLKIVVAPIVEETSKLLFIALAFLFVRNRISSATKVFGASLGLGFAFMENFGHVTSPLNTLFRGYSSWVMHIGTATLLAYCVWVVGKSRKNPAWIPACLMLAITIHGGFNALVLLLGCH